MSYNFALYFESIISYLRKLLSADLYSYFTRIYIPLWHSLSGSSWSHLICSVVRKSCISLSLSHFPYCSPYYIIIMFICVNYLYLTVNSTAITVLSFFSERKFSLKAYLVHPEQPHCIVQHLSPYVLQCIQWFSQSRPFQGSREQCDMTS